MRRWTNAVLRHTLPLLLIVFLITASVAQQQPVAVVQALTGQVKVKRAGSTGADIVTVGAVLGQGDLVNTGRDSKASLLFYDGSQVRLNAGTTIEIVASGATVENNRILIRLISGEIWAHLRPGWGIQTPSATATVRGTTFDIIARQDNSVVLTTFIGQVAFFNAAGSVVVNEAEQSIVLPGAAPSKPVTIPNPGLIVEWTVDLNRAAVPRELSLTHLTGAPLAETLASRRAAAARAGADAAAHAAYGQALFDSRQYAAALLEFQVADRLAPGQAATLIGLGYTLLELNRPDDAAAALRGAQTSMDVQAGAAASVGLAWVALQRDRPEDAQVLAEQALVADAGSSTARLVRGVALLRQPGKANQAGPDLQAAATSSDSQTAAQAHAWLALAALQQGDGKSALREAQQAVQVAPESALTQSSLALVYVFSGDPTRAAKAARLATRSDPNSPAAQVALSQSLLAEGDSDEAAAAAARAVALDPRLAQAHYMLGLADAQRRDYGHAVQSLQESVRLAPDFLPAASALARIYIRQGRNAEAIALLTGLQQRQANNDAVATALGEVYYEQAEYPQSIAHFQQAIQLNPLSALAYAGLARVALDNNRLNEAIDAAQHAVQLAPQVGQYHSILGLAYSYSRLNAQAEREFRAALATDPQNALAIAQLGFRNEEGDVRTAQRTAALATVQAFIYDPFVSHDLVRGGVHTELEGRIGNKTNGVDLTHRASLFDGQSNLLAQFNHAKDDGDRPNSDEKLDAGRLDATLVSGKRTNFYGRLFHSRDEGGLPSTLANPDVDDRRKDRFTDGVFAMRHRLERGTHLWVGYLGNYDRTERTNPNGDNSFDMPFFGGTTTVLNQTDSSHARSPEARIDFSLSRVPTRPTLLSIGAAQPHTRFKSAGLISSGGTYDIDQKSVTSLLYANLSQRVNERFSFSAQLRRQRPRGGPAGIIDLGGGSFNPLTFSQPSGRVFYLPSLMANYQWNNATAFRLFASRRATDVTSSIFAPVETLLTTEREALTTGLTDPFEGDQHVYEIDLEHRISARSFLKLFGFHSTARDVRYDLSGFVNQSDQDADGVLENSFLGIDRLRRSGAGARYEQQLGRSLFANLFGAVNRTTSYSPGQPFNGGSAPYHPRFTAGLGLNYINDRGLKLGVQVQHRGSFFQDPLIAVGARPRFPAKTYVNLRLAKEPSVHNEFFVQLNNLFNAQQVAFNGVPLAERRAQVGMVHRF